MTSSQIRGCIGDAHAATSEWALSHFKAAALLEIAYQLAIMNEREDKLRWKEFKEADREAKRNSPHPFSGGIPGPCEICGLSLYDLIHRTANEQPTAEPNPPEAKA